MSSRSLPVVVLLLVAALVPRLAGAQTVNGAIVGVVQDSSGAVVPDTALTLRNVTTDQTVGTTVSGPDGAYAFRNLSPAKYEVQALKPGFQLVTLSDVEVLLGSQVKLDVTLPVGAQEQKIEVIGGASALGTTPTQEHGISPETLNNLPLLFTSGPRAAATFALLMPGVSTGQGNDAFDARVNGGLQSGDEASVDGVSMQQGFMSQGGMVSILKDFPMSPDMVSQIKVLTSGYAPEYGSSTGGQIMAVTKSGGASFHGSGFEYNQDASMNAVAWGKEPAPFKKNNFGFNIGGPIAVPGLTTDKWKSFFYFDHERYRQKGGTSAGLLSIPSMQERQGDFRDWRDGNGNLIPIYDPATLRSDGNGGFIKDQFMGCDGNTPNVICANRINPIVQPWLAALPTPTSGGPLNNFLAPPIPDTILGDSDYYMWRLDTTFGSNHVFASFWHQRAPAKFYSQLPQSIATETYSDPQNSWVNRMNYDKIISNTLVNHAAMGYLNRNEGYGCVNQDFVDQFPQIGGVAGHNVPPQISLDEYSSMGCNAGVNLGNVTTRPTFIANDAVTWTKGAHTIKFGMEWRKVMGNIHQNGNEAGSFSFGDGATGISGINSGNGFASFLLGAADSASVAYRSVPSNFARQHAWIVHAGDSWRVNNKLTLDYGLRWDYYSPSSEKYDRLSFFDPAGANPGAGGRPGRLAFAGDGYGAASYGAPYPEKNWYGGLAPRLGAVYALNDKTVIRGGWGIFYTQAFYPNWGGGMNLDGFSLDPATVNATGGGVVPAMYLDQGFPVGQFSQPPDIRADYKNGQGIAYRNLDGNKRSYTHQWNITMDRELGHHFALSAAYVGSAGRRMPSSMDPLNAIDPKYLSLGSKLNDEFQPGMTSLDGVALPYAGWVEQLNAGSCAPSVAQALRPYPQYCDALQGMNEAHGTTLYNSMQLKLERRYSNGIYALVSYTLSHLMESGSNNTQRDANTWSGLTGVISPFERDKNYVISTSDTPHVLSAAFVYELPFGKGKKYAADKDGVVGGLVNGWQVSTIYKYQSGPPLYFRSGFCNVPGVFRAGCIPGIIDAGSVFAQDKGSYDPGNGPLFNAAAFEPASAFNYYTGKGNRVEETIRGFAYKNQDLTFLKNTRFGGGTNLQLRFEVFNLWNWHTFYGGSEGFGALPVNTDVSSPDFGKWNGNVTDPRILQLGIRFEF